MRKIQFQCHKCGRTFQVPAQKAGKKGRCPDCQTILVVPDAPKPETQQQKSPSIDDLLPQPGELRLKPEPDLNPPLHAYSSYEQNNMNIDEDTSARPKGQRQYIWFVDILLYPTSVPGITNLFIFWLLPHVIALITPFICCIPFLGFILQIIVLAYMLYYLASCVRDSADGGTRAPENIGDMPGLWEALGQLCYILATYILFSLVPFILYMWRGPDIFFVLALGVSIFLFPMGLLSTVLLDSISIFHPWLWISSIASTFLPYIGFIILMTLVGILSFLLFRALHPFEVFNLLPQAIPIYLNMICAHLLGRFYFRYEDRLRWDV